MHSHRSTFTSLKPCGFPLFFISHSSLYSAPWGVLLSPPIFIKVSLQFQPGPLVETAAPVMDLLGTWWERCDVRWADAVFTCHLARLQQRCGGVWRQSGRVCEVSVWMETEAPLLPSHPHSPYPDKGKATHWVRQCQTLVRIAPPVLLSFLPVSLPSFHFLSLSSFCHLASVFGAGLHKSWTAFPPGKRGILIEKEIRNENSHSFSGLCSVKARKCTRGKKTKCTGESVKEIGHVLKTKWKRGSLTSRLSLHYL